MAVEERETTTEEEAAPALSVSAAMGLAKNALEEVVVRLVGEVSEVNDKPGYKAVYFTVKDEKASLPCMMWMNRYRPRVWRFPSALWWSSRGVSPCTRPRGA